LAFLAIRKLKRFVLTRPAFADNIFVFTFARRNKNDKAPESAPAKVEPHRHCKIFREIFRQINLLALAKERRYL
jgi:hypothetical protein